MLIDRKLKPLASTVAGTVLCDQAITLRSARSRLWWGRRSRLAHHPMTTRFSANGISRSSFGRSRASMTRQASDATLAGMLPRSPLRAPPASDGGEPRRRQRRASDMVLGRRHVAKAQWGPAEPRRDHRRQVLRCSIGRAGPDVEAQAPQIERRPYASARYSTAIKLANQ